MKAYVISLPDSASRRASMVEQLRSTALEFAFVDAVDGRSLSTAARSKLVSEEAVARYPDWLTAGVIGCALSHRRAYEEIVRSSVEDVALVLEDDVTLPPGIAGLCVRVSSEMDGSEIVLLYFRAFGVCRFSARDAVELAAGTRLMYPIDAQQPITAAAYLISRAAARSLSEAIVPVRAAADSWGHYFAVGAIDSLRCVLPRPVGVRKDIGSTIHHGPGWVRALGAGYLSRRGLPGVVQVLTLNRHRVERRMSRTVVVPDRSPVAITRGRAGS